MARAHVRRLAVAAVAALSVAASGCALLPSHGVVARPGNTLPVAAKQQVTTVAVQQGNVAATEQVAGQVLPKQEALLFFKTGGTIQTLNMRDGVMVTKGEVLATLQAGNLPFQISQQQLTIQRDQLGIDDLETNSANSPPTSPADAFNRTIALKNAQISLQADQLALTKLQLQYSEYQIVAPYAGEIMNVKVHTGDGVGAYEELGELLDTSGGLFVAKLSAAQALVVSPGQQVKLTLSTDPQKAWTTTVDSVQVPTAAAAAIAKANQGFGGLTQPQATLKTPPGYHFTNKDVNAAFSGIITVAQVANALYLPNGVVFQLNGFDYVNLYEKGHVVQRAVTVGLQGDLGVVITSGLKDGDTVAQQ